MGSGNLDESRRVFVPESYYLEGTMNFFSLERSLIDEGLKKNTVLELELSDKFEQIVKDGKLFEF